MFSTFSTQIEKHGKWFSFFFRDSPSNPISYHIVCFFCFSFHSLAAHISMFSVISFILHFSLPHLLHLQSPISYLLHFSSTPPPTTSSSLPPQRRRAEQRATSASVRGLGFESVVV
ncbi:hypothetical protein Dimus_037330 [Dionaea muscipula]